MRISVSALCVISCAASSVPAQLLSAVDVVNLIRGITDLLSQYVG